MLLLHTLGPSHLTLIRYQCSRFSLLQGSLTGNRPQWTLFRTPDIFSRTSSPFEVFRVESISFLPTYASLDVFDAVQSSSASFGVVPFENSSNGSVLYTLDLLIDREGAFPDVYVCGEAFIDVQHCLLGYVSKYIAAENRNLHSSMSSGSATPTSTIPFPKEPQSKPMTDLRHIKRVYSHPQAFGQCEAFLSTYLKGVERHEVSSTSKAASIVAEDNGSAGTEAAISSRLAADVHHLAVLAKSVQDVQDNTTRFLVIQKGPVSHAKQALLPQKFHIEDNPKPKKKGLIAFNIDHGTRGALANALLVFKNHSLNLTSINSRPSRIRPWHYIFLVEVEGEKEFEDPDLLHSALQELDTVTEGNKWLGCWVDGFGITTSQ